MGTAFADSRSPTQSCDNFEELFGLVQSKTRRVFAVFHRRGRNTVSPKYARDQSAVETVGFSGHIGVYWDGRGIIDYLNKERIINGEYYDNFLDRLKPD